MLQLLEILRLKIYVLKPYYHKMWEGGEVKMSGPKIEVRLPVSIIDAKEFSTVNRAVGALACAPGSCGGGPGGQCQGSCRGCHEHISFQPEGAARPVKR